MYKRQPLINEGLILNNASNVKEIPGFDNGFLSIQDLGAQLASLLLDVKNDQSVLDVCAAPGGKLTSILENANVHLTALEKKDRRAAGPTAPAFGLTLLKIEFPKKIFL